MTPSRLWLRLAATSILVLMLAACGGGDGVPAGPAPGSGSEPAPPPAATGTTNALGSAAVGGTITFTGEARKLRPVAMDADPGCKAKHTGPVSSEVLVLGDGNTLGNVMVRVTSGLPEGNWPVGGTVTLDQDGCLYRPHVLGVMVGQPIKILNSDGLLHNVHALPSVNREFNQAMPASVTEIEKSFDKVEDTFEIKCDVHPWMKAYIRVLSHPFFAVTGSDGAFSIEGLPAGTYELEAWHEKLGTQTGSVTVEDGGSATIDFSFSAP